MTISQRTADYVTFTEEIMNLKVVTSVVAGKVFREYVQFLRNNCIGIMINCLLLNGNRID